MKIAIVDTLYPDFIAANPLQGGTYEEELQRILDKRFGTHDAYSRHLRLLGHECIDIIANHAELQALWREEREWPYPDASTHRTAFEQSMNVDVVFMQDLSVFPLHYLKRIKEMGYVLAGQCSCRFENDEILKQFDCIFSSFPFHVERFEKLGVKGVLLPLAFDPIVLERANVAPARTHAVSFVGGYGRHWDMDKLFVKLAEETPIQFWGYGYEKAPEIVRKKWRGHAWGLDMYDIYLSSHIVINRHGGISQGLSNNLRMFEATGCGALLMTEFSPNIGDYFAPGECVVYQSPQDTVDKINHLIGNAGEIQRIASNGQQRTLSRHTYFHRMPIVSKVLEECLAKRTVNA